MFGYAGKLLFVDLSKGTVEDRPLDPTLAKNFLGGPALGAKILYDEMPAKADVFGEDSMVGFVTGPFNNSRAFFGGRYTVVSKSPVTGGWNDANSGGFFGPSLKKAGYDGVFVKGIAKNPVYIFINDGKAEIKDASALWGLTTLATEAALRDAHGDKINAALIGPAGENLSHYAAVMNDGHRAAGRGGTGAVIGSKKLKALVVSGNQPTEVANKEAVTAINIEIKEWMDNGPTATAIKGYSAMGTGVGFVPSVLSGDAGIKNWAGSGVADYPAETAMPVSSQGMHEFVTKKYACSSCPMGCGAFLDMPSERWEIKHSARPEYETMGSFGSLLLNADAESVCSCNDLCNEYGFDTISAGSTIAWAMECYDKGVLSKDELDGIDLVWGDGDAIVEILEKICKNEGVGKILSKGTQAAADAFGKGHEYLVVAQGIEEPQHDSRLNYGMGRAYKYDPTPGRHVKGNMSGYSTAPGFTEIGTGYRDMLAVVNLEITNSSGMCMFGSLLANPNEAMMRLIEAVTGFSYTPMEKIALGLRMFNIRHAFNLREGIRRKDMTMSKRMNESPPPTTGPLAGMKIDFDLLGDNLFNAIGWDQDAVPLRESLVNIGGLEDVINDLFPSPLG